MRSFQHITLLLLFLCIYFVGSFGVNFGQSCKFEEDCGDIRLRCSPTETCECSSFYDWDSKEKKCNLNMTQLRAWLSSLEVEKDHRSFLDSEANSLLNHLGLFGVIALSVLFLWFLACSAVFCLPRDGDGEGPSPEKPSQTTAADLTSPMFLAMD